MNKLIFISFLFTGFACTAQSSWNTLFYTDVGGQKQLHSRLDTSTTFRISTGAASNVFSNSISLDDISYVEGNTRFVDFDLAQDKIKRNNVFSGETELDILHLDYRLKKGTLRAGYGYRSFAQFEFDEEFFTLLADGNAPFVGQTIEIGPQMHMGSYHQVYLGYAGKNKGFEYTIQAKFLSGVSHLQSINESVLMKTEEDIYQLSFDNNYSLNSSLIFKYKGIDDIDIRYSLIDFNNPIKGNFGFGLDLGLSYRFPSDSRLFLNVYDIGKINWTNLTRKYTSEGSFIYEGLDVVEFFNSGDEISVLDSLKTILEVEEELENYSSSLPLRIVIGYDYKLRPDLSLGMLVSSHDYPDGNQLLISLMGSKKFSSGFTAGLSYAYVDGVQAVGLHGTLSYKNIKIVGATDQLSSIIRLNSSRLASGRLGISLSL